MKKAKKIMIKLGCLLTFLLSQAPVVLGAGQTGGVSDVINIPEEMATITPTLNGSLAVSIEIAENATVTIGVRVYDQNGTEIDGNTIEFGYHPTIGTKTREFWVTLNIDNATYTKKIGTETFEGIVIGPFSEGDKIGTVTVLQPPVTLGWFPYLVVIPGSTTRAATFTIMVRIPRLAEILLDFSALEGTVGSQIIVEVRGLSQYGGPFTVLPGSVTAWLAENGTVSPTANATQTIFTLGTTAGVSTITVVVGTHTKISTVTVNPGVFGKIGADPGSCTIPEGGSSTILIRWQDQYGNITGRPGTPTIVVYPAGLGTATIVGDVIAFYATTTLMQGTLTISFGTVTGLVTVTVKAGPMAKLKFENIPPIMVVNHGNPATVTVQMLSAMGNPTTAGSSTAGVATAYILWQPNNIGGSVYPTTNKLQFSASATSFEIPIGAFWPYGTSVGTKKIGVYVDNKW